MSQSLSRTRLVLSLAAASVLAGAATASATECTDRVCTVTNTVQVHVGTVLRLSLQGSPLVVATASSETIQSGVQSGDGPSAVLLARCRAFHASPPPAGWDGCFDLGTK